MSKRLLQAPLFIGSFSGLFDLSHNTSLLMEGKQGFSSGYTVTGAEAPSNENVPASPISSDSSEELGKRLKMDGPDVPVTTTESRPTEFSAQQMYDDWLEFLERMRRKKEVLRNLVPIIEYAVGANYSPHIIKVNAGEDIKMKILSYCQEEPRVLCVLGATGEFSLAELYQSDTIGGNMTHEGRFEIHTMSGLFTPIKRQRKTRMEGKLSISFVNTLGRTVGGRIIGHITAATPVQVMVGTFEITQQNKRKRRTKATPSSTTPTNIPVSATKKENVVGKEQIYSDMVMADLPSSSNFPKYNSSSMHQMQNSENEEEDDNQMP